jgi:hypothetical protein
MYLMTEAESVTLPFCLKMERVRYSFLVRENRQNQLPLPEDGDG